MSALKAEVVLFQEGAEVGRYLLEPGAYTIGRSSECELQVKAGDVSRKHARLLVDESSILLEDMGSANGTLLDEEPVVGTVPVRPNQAIQIGLTRFLIQCRANLQRESASPDSESAVNDLPPEFLRAERYEVGPEIAKGGMGAILSAREVTTRRTVAMKVILGDAAVSTRHRLRFIDEAQITAQLEHPNIVPVHELGMDGTGKFFYTMKLVQGITLKKILELIQKGTVETIAKYSLPALLTIFQKVCDAVAFAHSKGVIHRDLKPANIMIGHFGEVLVMDWGLAKLLEDGTSKLVSSAGPPDGPSARDLRHATPAKVSTARQDEGNAFSTIEGAVLGTPHYMAPEQARGEIDQLDARTDIFALGAIFYHILTLHLPFPGKSIAQIIHKILSGAAVVPPVAFNKAAGEKALAHCPGGFIPESLSPVCLKALAHRPADRYPSVKALQADLLAYQNGFATSAESAGLARHLSLFLKRNRAVAVAAAAALLFCGTVFGGIQFRQHNVRLGQYRDLVVAGRVAAGQKQWDVAGGSLTRALAILDRKETRAELRKALLEGAKSELQRAQYGAAAIKLQEMLRLSADDTDAKALMPYALGEGFVSVETRFDGELLERLNDDALRPIPGEAGLRRHGPLPVKDLRLGQGAHQFEIRRDGKRWCSLPIEVKRAGRAKITIPITEIPAGYEYVHEGEFIQGDDGTTQADGFIGKRAQSIGGFFIRSTVVTSEEYFRFRKSSDYTRFIRTALEREKLTAGDIQPGAQTPADLQTFTEEALNSEKLSVRALSYYEAAAFAEWAGGRLPTEREWEKAARGIDGRIFASGNDPPELIESPMAGLTPREKLQISPYGCLGLTENLWQWTSSPSEEGSSRFIVKGGTGRGAIVDRKPARRKAMDPKAKYHSVGVILCKDLPAAASDRK